MLSERTRHARDLFDGIARAYDRPANVLSLGQYGRWRRALVREMNLEPGAQVLDVATGTGLIARDMERDGAHVTGLDQSEEMIAASRKRAHRPLVRADGTRLPFRDATFDVVTFSYLLRYVDDPAGVVFDLARLVKPGGMLGSVEFGLPPHVLAREGWRVYAQGIMPVAARAFGSEWRGVGTFLPRSITAWARAWPVEKQLAAWRAAGIEEPRARGLTLGTGVIMWGRKR